MSLSCLNPWNCMSVRCIHFQWTCSKFALFSSDFTKSIRNFNLNFLIKYSIIPKLLINNSISSFCFKSAINFDCVSHLTHYCLRVTISLSNLIPILYAHLVPSISPPTLPHYYDRNLTSFSTNSTTSPSISKSTNSEVTRVASNLARSTFSDKPRFLHPSLGHLF